MFARGSTIATEVNRALLAAIDDVVHDHHTRHLTVGIQLEQVPHWSHVRRRIRTRVTLARIHSDAELLRVGDAVCFDQNLTLIAEQITVTGIVKQDEFGGANGTERHFQLIEPRSAVDSATLDIRIVIAVVGTADSDEVGSRSRCGERQIRVGEDAPRDFTGSDPVIAEGQFIAKDIEHAEHRIQRRTDLFRIDVDLNRLAPEQLNPKQVNVQPALDRVTLIVADHSRSKEGG